MPVIDSARGVADLRALEPLRWKADEVVLLGDQVLVEPIEDEQKERFEAKIGSLYIPQKAERDKKRELHRRGRVVAVGPGDKFGQRKVKADPVTGPYIPACALDPKHCPDGRFPMSVKPGDLVLYERRAGSDINLNGKTYVILLEQAHIAAVIEE